MRFPGARDRDLNDGAIVERGLESASQQAGVDDELSAGDETTRPSNSRSATLVYPASVSDGSR